MIKCGEWDPFTLHASSSTRSRLKHFRVDIPVDPRGSINCYIDDTPGLTVNITGTENASQLEAAIPLAIEVAARPDNMNKPIPRKTMVAKDKQLAGGGLSETKVIL